MKMLHLKKKAIVLAVANASMIFALDVASREIMVTNGANAGSGSLREALGTVRRGDHVLIDAQVENIYLEGQISFYSEGLIISAPVDDAGRPQVTITAAGPASLTENRIFNISPYGEADNPVTIISGLTLTGGYTESGANQAWGGAIQGAGVDVFLDKTVIAGNRAHGAGGGIAIKGGSLCLRGSEVSGNTVETAQGNSRKYAIGGGAAVSEGVIVVVPSIDEQLTQSKYVDDCLLSDAAQAAFTDISPEFSEAVTLIALNPEGIDIIKSAVTGNTASVRTSDGNTPDVQMVVGGGLASVSDAPVQVPSWIKYSPVSRPVGISVFQAEISDNKALVYNVDLTGGGKVQAAGGGLFVGQPRGVAPRADIVQSVVSGNEITVGETLEGGADITSVVGAGVGTVSSNEWYSETGGFWDSSGGSPGGGTDEKSKYKSPAVYLSTSTVTGNTITANQIESTANALIMGGGVGMFSYGEQDGINRDQYQNPVAFSFLSVVSENSIDVKRSNDSAVANTSLAVVGGGIGVVDFNSQFGTLNLSKYVGYFSAMVGNDITVTSTSSVEQDDAETSISGGGVFAALGGPYNSKPQFMILSGNTGADAPGLNIPDAVLTAPGGVQDNAVTFNSDGNEGDVGLAGGGLSLQAVLSRNAQVLGNSITIDSGNSGDANIVATGGGLSVQAAVNPDLGYGAGGGFVSKSVVADNDIIVTSGAGVSAAGGGIFASSESSLRIDSAELSGNKIQTVGTSARGAGLALMSSPGPSLGGTKYNSVQNSTIANNQITAQSSSATVAGAGIALDSDSYSEFYLDELTIVGNTGSRNGTPTGGQLHAVLGGNNVIFSLEKSLISGNTAQGASDFIYEEGKNTIDVAYTAVFWGAAAPAIDGFLDPSVADPAFLGSLANNGGKYAEYSPFNTEGPVGISSRTIALLDGSSAINAGGAPGCDPDQSGGFGFDQRGRDRDECGDIGAFEAGSDVDLDGLTDSVEQTAAGTDPEILKANNPEGFALLLKNGDGNSDGLPDYEQDNVASFSINNDGVMTLAVTSNLPPALFDVSTVVGIEAGGYDLSLGGVSFTVLSGDGTDPVGLSLIVPNVANASQSLVKRVCNSELGVPEDPQEGWEVISDAPEAFGSDRLIFNFELTPNGPFDCNGSAPNILDPIYVATGGITPPTPPTPPGDAVPVPSMPAILYVLMSGAMGLLGLCGLRPRKKKPRQ